MKHFVSSLIFLLFTLNLLSQVVATTELYRTVQAHDSLLFEVGFNNCDIAQLENLVSDDFEFYHDKSGMITSKAAFIASVRDGLCKMDYRAARELIKNSTGVYPLEKEGVLYGAVQTGVHRFFEVRDGQPRRQTSIARFTHLWLIEDGHWKLSRVMSYDHINSK